MKRIVVVAVLALGLVCAQPVTAKKPPSFALWNAGWKAKHDPEIDKVGDACLAVYGENDGRVGPCFAKGVSAVLRRQKPVWEKEVARIALGQTARCRRAIHGYWLAVRKTQAAFLIFLDAHKGASMTDIVDGLKEDPNVTLKELSDAAKARAIRICG